MGQLIESLLILKKLHRFLPSSAAIKHNLIFVSLLGEWYFDTCTMFGMDQNGASPDIKAMMKFCRITLNKIITDSKSKMEERRQKKMLRSASHEDVGSESNGFELPKSFDSPFGFQSRKSFIPLCSLSKEHTPTKKHVNDRCRVIEYNRQLKQVLKACNIQSEAIQRELEREKIEKQNIIFEAYQLKTPRNFAITGRINYKPFKFNEIRWDSFQAKETKKKKRPVSASKAAIETGN